MNHNIVLESLSNTNLNPFAYTTDRRLEHMNPNFIQKRILFIIDIKRTMNLVKFNYLTNLIHKQDYNGINCINVVTFGNQLNEFNFHDLINIKNHGRDSKIMPLIDWLKNYFTNNINHVIKIFFVTGSYIIDSTEFIERFSDSIADIKDFINVDFTAIAITRNPDISVFTEFGLLNSFAPPTLLVFSMKNNSYSFQYNFKKSLQEFQKTDFIRVSTNRPILKRFFWNTPNTEITISKNMPFIRESNDIEIFYADIKTPIYFNELNTGHPYILIIINMLKSLIFRKEKYNNKIYEYMNRFMNIYEPCVAKQNILRSVQELEQISLLELNSSFASNTFFTANNSMNDIASVPKHTDWISIDKNDVFFFRMTFSYYMTDVRYPLPLFIVDDKYVFVESDLNIVYNMVEVKSDFNKYKGRLNVSIKMNNVIKELRFNYGTGFITNTEIIDAMSVNKNTFIETNGDIIEQINNNILIPVDFHIIVYDHVSFNTVHSKELKIISLSPKDFEYVRQVKNGKLYVDPISKVISVNNNPIIEKPSIIIQPKVESSTFSSNNNHCDLDTLAYVASYAFQQEFGDEIMSD